MTARSLVRAGALILILWSAILLAITAIAGPI